MSGALFYAACQPSLIQKGLHKANILILISVFTETEGKKDEVTCPKSQGGFQIDDLWTLKPVVFW